MFAFLNRIPFLSAKPETKSLADPSGDLLRLFGGTPSAAGISVSAHAAMGCPPVRAAVQSIAEPIGATPIHLHRRAADGSRKRITDHPVAKLLSDRANDWTSAAEFREQLQRDCLLHGDGIAVIVRVNGQPRELIRMVPGAVSVQPDLTTGEPIYALNIANGQSRPIDRRDVLHVKSPSICGYRGESPVQQCREAIAICIVLERHCATLFGRGGRPDGVLQMPGSLRPEDVNRIAASWQAQFGGKSGGTPVLEQGLEFKPVAFNSTDSEFLEHRRNAVIEICRIFRTPPHIVFALERGTWSNVELLGAEFVRYTLSHWATVWESEIRLKLLDDPALFAEFNFDALLRGSTLDRAQAYAQFRSAGIMTANECRARENLPPMENGDVLENPYTTPGTAP